MPIPENYEAYRRTPDFTEASVPAGLLSAHSTKHGVWALIRVIEGRLLYRVLASGLEEVLEAGGRPGVIEPEILHEVAPLGPVRFFVEFYRQPHERERGP